ncbi:MAG TPA: septum formation initiator family protein [Acidimicrobiales bacterium]|nr:septum formation initiator family protein [Acidimicrobiales bacterium]
MTAPPVSVRRRRHLGLLLASVVLVGLLFLFVLPARTYLSQHNNLSAAATRMKVLSAENAKLEQRVKQLQTDAEIERLARQYGLVKPGEQAYALLPPKQPAPPPTPPKKPSHHGWWEFWK